MGFLDSLLGNDAADASRKAAGDTYAKQQAATQGLTQFGDQYASRFGDLSKGFEPWRNTGLEANDAVRQLLANPQTVSSLPGYQFGLDQGTKAIDHSALANGSLFSGKTGKALQSFGTNYADQKYGEHLSRLLGISEQGRSATAQGVGTEAQGLTGQLGARTSAYGGDMTSAGTIGQGDIAAANAKAQGSQNILNAGMKLGGMMLAPFTGGMSMGGSLGSLLGGGGGGIVLGGAGGPGQFRS